MFVVKLEIWIMQRRIQIPGTLANILIVSFCVFENYGRVWNKQSVDLKDVDKNLMNSNWFMLHQIW